MSSSRALCCFPSVKKQNINSIFCFVQCIITELLDSIFVIFRIIKVSIRVINRRLRLITLIQYSGYHRNLTQYFFYNLTTHRLAEYKQFIATNFFCIDNVIQTCIQSTFNLSIVRPTSLLRYSRSTLALHKFLAVILCSKQPQESKPRNEAH